MRNLLLFPVLLLIGFSAESQAICGFDIIHHKRMQTDSLYRRAVNENEKAIQRYLLKNKSNLSARTTGTNAVSYTIPVVVHVIHTGGPVGSIYNPTDAQIKGAIDYLNQVYNGTYPGTEGIGDLQLQFVLAAKDGLCNNSSGIERIDASEVSGYTVDGVSSDFGNTPGVDQLSIKGVSRWNPFNYYNIWVVNKIDGKDGTSGSFIAGFATLPPTEPSQDGTILLATQMMAGQKTLPHELAHAFGLYHTFEGSNDRNSCPVNDNCDANGDKVCDTDPESFNRLNGIVDFSCRTGTNACTGSNYSINTEHNYMNYTNCYSLFTAGQKARMLAFAAGGYRRSLTTSLATGTGSLLAGYSSPIAPSCTPTTSPTGLSGNFAGILAVDLNGRTVGSSLAIFDNGYVDATTNCLNLIQLNKAGTYTFTATLAGINNEQVRAWIDFNNDGAFNNSTEQILFVNGVSWTSPTVSANFTVPATATLNTVLRMRVIDDLSTVFGVPLISSGCTTPVYGQAEDYPVYISASGVLPVTFNSFTGELKNKVAMLSWTTSAEQNLKSFDIEKSTNGREFSKIGSVDALNNSSSTNRYTYTDQNLSENNYYRIRTNETTGSEKLSSIVLVHYTSQNESLWLVKNPFTNSLQIGCGKPGFPARLRLLNSVGAVVAEKTVTTQLGQMEWNIQTSLSSGVYILTASAFGQTFTYKVIKQD
jgi:hypothetical protein